MLGFLSVPSVLLCLQTVVSLLGHPRDDYCLLGLLTGCIRNHTSTLAIIVSGAQARPAIVSGGVTGKSCRLLVTGNGPSFLNCSACGPHKTDGQPWLGLGPHLNLSLDKA